MPFTFDARAGRARAAAGPLSQRRRTMRAGVAVSPPEKAAARKRRRVRETAVSVSGAGGAYRSIHSCSGPSFSGDLQLIDARRVFSLHFPGVIISARGGTPYLPRASPSLGIGRRLRSQGGSKTSVKEGPDGPVVLTLPPGGRGDCSAGGGDH